MARGEPLEGSLAKRARPAPVSSQESDVHTFRRQQHQDQIADGRRRSSYLRCEAIPALSVCARTPHQRPLSVPVGPTPPPSMSRSFLQTRSLPPIASVF